ncbi:hypothetical protein Hanom_Chr10g00912301 [Helianthus anomalus]
MDLFACCWICLLVASVIVSICKCKNKINACFCCFVAVSVGLIRFGSIFMRICIRQWMLTTQMLLIVKRQLKRINQNSCGIMMRLWTLSKLASLNV